MSGFDIAAVLDEAWSLTKRQYWHWLLVVVLAVAIPLAIIVVGALAAMAVPALGAIVIFIGVLGFFYTFLGLLRNAYNASEGAKPSVGVLLRSDRFWWFLVAGAVYIGIVVVGLFRLHYSRTDLGVHVRTISLCTYWQARHDRFWCTSHELGINYHFVLALHWVPNRINRRDGSTHRSCSFCSVNFGCRGSRQPECADRNPVRHRIYSRCTHQRIRCGIHLPC